MVWKHESCLWENRTLFLKPFELFSGFLSIQLYSVRMSGFKKAKFHFSEDTEFVYVSAYRLQADPGWGGLLGFHVVRADFAQVANPSGTELFQ